MLNSLLSMMFRCSHRRTTFPFTPARKASLAPTGAVARHGTYIVCLDCGKEFDYNWNEMRVGSAVASAPVRTRPAESLSAAHR
jgi:hypothetical protein